MQNNSDFEPSPLSCDILNGIGVYYAFLLLSSICLNSTLLCTSLKHKDLRKPANLTNISLVLADLVLSLFDLPILTVNAFNCGYWMVCKPTDKRFTKNKPIMILIALIVAYGVIWTTAPFTGWSSIELEPSKLGCMVDMYLMEPKEVAFFAVVLMTFLFGLPFSVVIYFNYKVIKKIKEVGKRVSTKREKSKLKKEKSLTLFTITLIVCILIINIPYALHFTYVSYIEPGVQLPLTSALTNALGKTIYAWAAVINIVLNTDVKKYFKSKSQIQIHIATN